MDDTTDLDEVSFMCTDLCYSEEQAKLAARKYARIVQKLGFPVCYLA